MIGDFNYDYEAGSGEEVVPKPLVGTGPAAVQVQRFNAQIANPTATATNTASGVVALPPTLLHGAAGSNVPMLFAKITLALPPLAHAGDVTVVVDAPGGGPMSPANTITLSMFGHHLVTAPVTFTVPLTAPVAALRASNRLGTNTLHFRVFEPTAMMPATMHAHVAAAQAEVLSIVVEAH